MQFLGKVSEGFFDKLKNILFAFGIYFLYILLFQKWMTFLLTDQIFFKAPPFKFTFFMTVVFAGIWEEIAFRWLPLTLVKDQPKLILPTVIFTSILFGVLHGGPVNIMIQGVMGFTLSCVYLKNGHSLWSAILLHSGWNAFVILVLEKLAQ